MDQAKPLPNEFAFVRLLPEQIATIWPSVNEAIATTLPPNIEKLSQHLSGILMQLMSGQMQFWVAQQKDPWPPTVLAFILTRIEEEPATGTRILLIYSLYSVTIIEDWMWLGSFKTLRKFALGNNCTKMVAYTRHQHIVDAAEKIGADVSHRVISFDL
jgi:hypothetical protein